MESNNSSRHPLVRNISCPSCGAAYRISEAALGKKGLKAKCKKCGATFSVTNQSPMTQNTPPSSPHPDPPDESEKEAKAKYQVTPVLQREVPSGGHDPIATFIIAISIAAILFCGFMAIRSLGKAGSFDHVSGLVESFSRKLLSLPFKKQHRAPRRRVGKPGSYNDFLKQGHRYFRKKDYSRAIRAYSEAIRLKADSVEASYWRGRAYQEKGDLQHALQDFQKTIALDPTYVHAYNHIAWIYLGARKWDKAVAYLTRSLEIAPLDGWAYYNRGRCYFEMGETEKALADAKKACDLGFDLGCRVYKKYKQ